ncbi:hydantoinase/oxoprolinase family protein [Fodinicurvata halophila]
MLASDIKHKLSRSFITPLGALTPERFEVLKAELAEEAAELLGEEGYEEAAQKLSFEIDLRYMGQSSELTVALPEGKLDAVHRQAIYEAFQRDYQTTYGYNNEEPLEMVCLRLTAVGHLENRLRFEHTKAQLEKTETSQSRRAVYFEREQGYVDTAVVSRAMIDSVPRSGPMIVETYDTTIIIPPWAQVHEDSFGSLIIERSSDNKKPSDEQSVGREA